MASPSVTGTPVGTLETSGATSMEVTITMGDGSSGDRLFILFAKDGDDAPSIESAHGTFTEHVNDSYTPGPDEVCTALWSIAYDDISGTPSSIGVSWTDSERAGAVAWWVDDDGTIDVSSVTNTDGDTTPDTPALTPAGGSDDYLYIACLTSDGGSTLDSGPSGFTEILYTEGGGGQGVKLGAAYLETTSSTTQDPGTWSYSGFGTATQTFTISMAPGDTALAITPAAETVNVTAGTLTVDMNTALTGAAVSVTAGTASLSIDVPLTGPTVSVTPGAATITTGAVDITPDPTTVTVTAGTLSVVPDQPLSLTGPTVTVTPGTVTVVESQPITPGAVTVTATAGTLTVAPGAVDITPDPTTVSVTAGTLSVTQDAQDITPDPTTVTVTAGTVTLIQEQFIVPDPTTVTVTAGTVTLDMNVDLTGATVTATSGTLTVAPGAVDITPENVTVTITPGTLTIGGVIAGQIHLEGGVSASRLGGSVQSTSRGGTLTASRTE